MIPSAFYEASFPMIFLKMNKDTTTTKENSIPIFPVNINTKNKLLKRSLQNEFNTTLKNSHCEKVCCISRMSGYLAFENK